MLNVATTDTDESYLLLIHQLGIGGLTTHLELSLLLVNWHAATSISPLVSRIPRNTHSS